jgi:hypothetical protein
MMKTKKIKWRRVKAGSGINEILTEEAKTLKKEEKIDYYLVKQNPPSRHHLFAIANEEQISERLKSNFYMYEILSPEKKKKVYFDIDLKPTKEDNFQRHIEKCKEVILETFPNANFQISGSQKETKFSLHIILSNYHTINTQILKKFSEKHSDLGFDTLVYSKFNVFKCINQSKPEKHSTIQSYIEGSMELSKHLVLMNFDNDSKNITEIEYFHTLLEHLENNKNDKQLELIDINPNDIKFQIPDQLDYVNETALNKLRLIPNPPRDNCVGIKRDISLKLLSWCFKEGIPFVQFWDWCKQRDNSKERKDKYNGYYNEQNENKKLDYLTESFIDTLLLKFYPRIKDEKKVITFLKDNQLNHTKIIPEDFLKAINIDRNVKYSFLDIRMGGNKTGANIDFIKDSDKDWSVLFLSPRIALSRNIQQRMLEKGLEFVNYEDVPDKKDLIYKDRLIMSVCSLHYLQDKKYDLILIDEIETIWDSFNGEAKTHRENPNHNWETFEYLLKNSKKTVIMDALMTQKTIETIKRIDNDARSFELLQLQSKQAPRKMIKYVEEKSDDGMVDTWFDDLFSCIKRNENIAIFMPYKWNKENSSKRHKWAGVETLVKAICHMFNLKQGQDVIGYYSETKLEKEQLGDIKTIWKRARVVVFNTCLAVGVNFDVKNHFDKVFAYFTNWIGTRDFIQSLYRVRYPKSNIMNVFFEKNRFNNQNAIERGFRAISNNLQYLHTSLFNEKKVKALDRMNVLMNRCNITIETENDEDLDRIANIRFTCLKDFSIGYDDIQDLTKDEFDKMKTEIDTGFNSLLEKLKYEKYLLKGRFKKDITEDKLKWLWNNFEKPVVAITKIIVKDNHLLNTIFHELGYASFIDFVLSNPKDSTISTLLIPNSITNNDLKKTFIFRNELKLRNTNFIQTLINGFFGYQVFKLDKDENNKIKRIIHPVTKKKLNRWTIDESFTECINLFANFSKTYYKRITREKEIEETDIFE